MSRQVKSQFILQPFIAPVDVSVLAEQHLADISIAGLRRQVESRPGLLVEHVNPGVHVQEDLDEVEMSVTGGQQERRPAGPE